VKKGPLFLCPNIGAMTGILLSIFKQQYFYHAKSGVWQFHFLQTDFLTCRAEDGLVLTVLEDMTVNHVIEEQMAIKKQQQVPIQWDVPPKISNFLNGKIDGVGSNKRIILKKKQQQ
jgi:hypothetical protein